MGKVRSFNMKWKCEFPWLLYENGKMFCDVCCKARMKNAFTSGCENFQRSALTRHIDPTGKDSSAQHLRALQILKQQELFKTSAKNTIAKCEKQENFQMRTVYWLAKEEVAEAKFASLIELQKINGVDFPGGTYQHRSVVSEMTLALSQAVEQSMVNELKMSSFFGVICDESSDVSNYKKLILYLTYVNESGLGKTAFIDILNIDDGKAETILNYVQKTVQKLEIDLIKIVGLGTDGAAVMTGCKGGVGVRLKDAGASYLIQVHCCAHRVSLALSQASKNVPEIKNLEIVLGQLYHFFDDSPVRESVLRQIYEINDMPEIKLKELKNVRWLSFYEAVKAVIACFEAIVQALEHITERQNDLNSVKAKGLLMKIKAYSFPSLLSVVLDVLEPVKKLNLIFQQQNIIFSKIQPMVSCCINVLENLKENEGENERNYLEMCQTEDDNDNIVYKNVKLEGRSSIENIKHNFISEVVTNLRNRFPEESLNVLKSLDAILNPSSYPTNKVELNNYGSQELEILIKQYGHCETGLICENNLRKDFEYFKQIAMNFKSLSMNDFIQKIITQYSEDFPEFVKLAKIAATLPISSADAERGFSAMKRIKTNCRNRMSEAKLKQLMMISLQGPALSVSQDIVSNACNTFNMSKTRRGNQ